MTKSALHSPNPHFLLRADPTPQQAGGSSQRSLFSHRLAASLSSPPALHSARPAAPPDPSLQTVLQNSLAGPPLSAGGHVQRRGFRLTFNEGLVGLTALRDSNSNGYKRPRPGNGHFPAWEGICIPPLPPPCCVALGKSFPLSNLQFL